MNKTRANLSRIPYLDGLRAFSIFAVILNHSFVLTGTAYLQFEAFGQLGVRIFFVLSGFLITQLLLDEYDTTGKISIRGFYERRIARIFPAFYLYLGVVLLGTLVHVFNVDRAAFLAAGTFTWNLNHFWRHGADLSVNNSLVWHFWTLSVEEQFYLLWPTCIGLLGKRWAARLAIAGVIFLPLVRVAALLFLHPSALQSNILYRYPQDELLWGVLLSFAVRKGLLDRLRNFRFRLALPWISGILIFLVSPLLEMPYAPRGMNSYLTFTLQGIAIVFLIAWLLSGEGGVFRSLLESWPAVQVGLLSFSLYLWQQMFVTWPGMYWLPAPLRVVLALTVAILCYRLWELPMRKKIRQWFHQARLTHT